MPDFTDLEARGIPTGPVGSLRAAVQAASLERDSCSTLTRSLATDLVSVGGTARARTPAAS
jgi:hypothetical protein